MPSLPAGSPAFVVADAAFASHKARVAGFRISEGGAPAGQLKVPLVTSVVCITTPDTVWMVTDRRLSFGAGRRPREDGVKVMSLRTLDGLALLGYCGLGRTGRGTEPSAWMASTLRGVVGDMEALLSYLASVAELELPRHLKDFPRTLLASHSIVAPCFVGEVVQLFSIDLALSEDRSDLSFRFTRHTRDGAASSPPPRVVLAGAGGVALSKSRVKWQRQLLNIVRAHDRDAVSAHTVADALAAVNLRAHNSVSDDSVGPRSIVCWSYRRGGIHAGLDSHQCYIGDTRELETCEIPTIAMGNDVQAIGRAIAGVTISPSAEDVEALGRAIRGVSNQPDHRLR